jgi:class 3 adenylate cyclase
MAIIDAILPPAILLYSRTGQGARMRANKKVAAKTRAKAKPKAPGIEPRILEAEKAMDRSPADAAPLLAELAQEGVAPDTRVQALAIQAILAAGRGSDDGMREAEEKLRVAAGIKVRTPVAGARFAHARGYLAYKRGERAVVLSELNKAASLYPADDRRRAQVFDTLGMHFQHTIGDLERARAYYLLSIELKEKAAASTERDERPGLALTFGNLGRLELWRERFDEAEIWLQKDLDTLLAIDPRPIAEAIVRDNLAMALMGRGSDYYPRARLELEKAMQVVAPESLAHVYVLKDSARLALLEDKPLDAERHARTAHGIAEKRGYNEAMLALRFVEASIAARRAQRFGDDAFTQATLAFDDAQRGFERLGMPRETCEVAVARADLLDRLGKKPEAMRPLVEVALPVAEQHLFGQLQPLARIENRIGELDEGTLLRLRADRMRGGIAAKNYTGRLRGDRHRVTVWTCDIRGFTSYCEDTKDPLLIVNMLNRLFAAIGRLIIDHEGYIDKYVGDNILAYFDKAAPAAGVALAALDAVRQVNTEREHLRERVLDIGIGLATGEVVEGNVGFSAKLEHTIIGSAVNTACRLVGVADPGEILVDGPTREALGDGFACRDPGRKFTLKGLKDVQVFTLGGRKRPR